MKYRQSFLTRHINNPSVIQFQKIFNPKSDLQLFIYRNKENNEMKPQFVHSKRID